LRPLAKQSNLPSDSSSSGPPFRTFFQASCSPEEHRTRHTLYASFSLSSIDVFTTYYSARTPPCHIVCSYAWISFECARRFRCRAYRNV